MIDSMPDLATMPRELRELSQWVCWRAETRDSRVTKVPYDTLGGHASSTNPSTWTTAGDALKEVEIGRFDGIGFVFTPMDQYAGIDLDKSVVDGKIAEWAQAILDRFPSYAEYSPSGTGVHIITRGSLPGPGRKTAHIEIYDRGRYFTMTGRRVNDCDITDCDDELRRLYDELAPKAKASSNGHTAPPSLPGESSLDDDALIDRALTASNSAKFSDLWAGNTTGYASGSEATAALLAMLAFWTNRDPDQMDRLFRRSGLMRDKWDTKRGQRTWGAEEVDRAIGRATEGYEASGRVIVSSASTTDDDFDMIQMELTTAPWPEPPDSAVYHGLAGEMVDAIEPYTEADPIAILIQFLVDFGNLIGRGPHFKAEGSDHFTNLFVGLVGATAKGRKGSSRAHALRMSRLADEEWAKTRRLSGLSSGEGLIWAVRDPITTHERKPRTNVYEDIETDKGVKDKRLLIFEGEFASVLKVLGRQGNTLSTCLRQAWDEGYLNTMVKTSPAKATGAHISLISHVTRDELLKEMTNTETSNGFANRFLWFCVRRSKLLPDGDEAERIDLRPFVSRLIKTVDTARGITTMRRDDEARALWHSVYADLSDGRPGLLGLVTSRAEAQVMRVACVYALLDRSPLVRLPHLTAALALWRYSEDSCRWIFGDTLGDPTADEILGMLKKHGSLTRTEIRTGLGRHKTKAETERALGLLYRNGQAKRIVEQTGGRPVETWYLCETTQ